MESQMESYEKAVSPKNYPWKLEGDSPFYGWVSSFESCKEVLNKFQDWSSYYHYASFATYSVQAEDFGETDLNKHAHFVLFEGKKLDTKKFPLLEFDGVPFMHVNTMKLDCSRGKQRNKVKTIEDHGNDSSVTNKRRDRSSKKLNCPAQLVVQEVVRFPDFKITANTERRKKDASKKLRAALRSGNLNYERRFYICLPRSTDHQNHKLDESEGSLQSIDERLKIKIRELVADGVEAPAEIKRLLNHYVNSEKDNWFPDGCLPPKINRRFFPNNEDIRNHIRIAKTAYKNAELPVENQCTDSVDTVVAEYSSCVSVPSVAKVTLPQLFSSTLAQVSDSTPIVMKDIQPLKLRHTAADCRTVLNKLRSATYLLQCESDVVEEMYVKLKDILEWLEGNMSNQQLRSETRKVQLPTGTTDTSEPESKRAKTVEVNSLISAIQASNENNQICLNNGDILVIEVAESIL